MVIFFPSRFQQQVQNAEASEASASNDGRPGIRHLQKVSGNFEKKNNRICLLLYELVYVSWDSPKESQSHGEKVD